MQDLAGAELCLLIVAALRIYLQSLSAQFFQLLCRGRGCYLHKRHRHHFLGQLGGHSFRIPFTSFTLPHRPSLHHPTLALQIVTAGDAFANFIDPAAPQPSLLKGRLVALVPTAVGLQVIARNGTAAFLMRAHSLARSYGPQRLPLEFGVYVGAHAAEQNAWRPKMGMLTLMHVATRPLKFQTPFRRFVSICLPA